MLKKGEQTITQSLLLFLIITTLSACAPTVQILRESSIPTPPVWIKKLPRSSNTLYFVGIRTSAPTLEEGQNAALKDAMAKISNHLGSKIESSFEDYSTEIEQQLTQQIKSKTTATIHGAKVEDSYYEKTTRIEGKLRLEKYNVYVLVSFSKEAGLKEIERQQQEKRQKALTAYDYYLQGVESEEQGKYYEAQNFYQQALKILAGLDDVISLDKSQVQTSHELQLKLNTSLQKVKAELSKISINITINTSEQGQQAFLSGFTSTLAQHGFTITDQNPAIQITGEVFVKKSSLVSNYLGYNYVYYAQGNVSARRTSDRQEIAVYPFQAKGFHRSKEQAALNALSEAGLEAGNGLVEMILNKEESKIE